MTTDTVSEVRKGRKFEQVVAGALRVFLRDGFEGASVDNIAREARVSKATLYSYFPDKRIMFAEVFGGECQRLSQEANGGLDRGQPAREFLVAAAQSVMAFTLSEPGRSLFRLVVAEGARFPDLAQQFYRQGPAQLLDRLIGPLRDLCARGELEVEDFELAAEQFVQLCRAGVHERLIFDEASPLPKEQISRATRGAVEMFLTHYGVAE